MNNYDSWGLYRSQVNFPSYKTEKAQLSKDGPILIDLDPKTWEQHLDRIGQWLGNTLMAQISYHQLAQDTVSKIQEPHIRQAITDITFHAANHIRAVEELFSLIDRHPYFFSQYGGHASAMLKETISGLKGMLGGAQGDWQMLHQLLLTNMNTLGAFAVTEQFGLLLGLSEITQITLPIIHQKQTDQLVINEYMLEMASISIVYQQNI
ncbi:hypothetical protein GH741_02010 [Aquibacillus halophilus]|uniref:Uncharacterized protein n=1 Tax=Aquibacillus halophilus TaxID=930132 RepID=A0A6A8DF11_9BACI|nr:hypothetical protein [Aquibacillus halophilus]MRH41447.1 hypothetical protein [Aquibacillus halophilus]